MAIYLYMLRSLKDGRTYTGITKDVEQRLRQHNDGMSRSTRHRRPFVLVHTEAYPSRREALWREKFLKSLEGSVEKMRILASGGTGLPGTDDRKE